VGSMCNRGNKPTVPSVVNALQHKTPCTRIPCCAAQHPAHSYGSCESRCSTPKDVYSSTTTIMSTHITFHGGNGGGGGGGGSPAFSPGINTGSGQNSYQENTGADQSMLRIRREHLNIDVGSVPRSGYITTIPSIRMPRRLTLTANCYASGTGSKFNFAFIIDVLLVPLSFNVNTCFDLYLEPFDPASRAWFMGTRRLRDNIISLRRFAVQGELLACAVEQFDIPEDIRDRTDYRLVITCPVFHYTTPCTTRNLYFQLEMEF